MKEQRILKFTAAVIFAVCVLSCNDSKEIKIGAIISLTSPAGPQRDGEGVRDGLIMAADELNARGGLNGRKLRVIVEDGKSNLETAKAAFQKIERAYKPLFYIATLSPICIGLSPAADQAQVVLFSLIASVKEVTQNSSWVYRYWPVVENDAPVQISTLKKIDAKKLGILHLDDSYGKAYAEFTAKEFRRIGGLVKMQAFKPEKMDLTGQIVGLHDSDAILVIGQSAQLPIVLKQLHERKFTGAVLVNTSIAIPALMALPEVEGAYSAIPIIFNPSYLAARDFEKTFQTKYGHAADHAAAAGYDLILLLSQLMEDKAVSRMSLKTALEAGFNHSGPLGDVRLEPGVRDLAFPLFPVQIVNGQPQYK